MQINTAQPLSPPPPSADELEAYKVLLDLLRRKTGTIPEPVLARHVLAVTEGADWPVQRAAMDALLRRLGSAQKDGLRVAARPQRGRVLGIYETRRKGRQGGPRPYVTLLESVDPPAGSCSCPDFAKSSLGLCKHLLTLLAAIHSLPRKLAAALKEQALRRAAGPDRLIFHPIRPLTGPGDWLMQVRWRHGEKGGGATVAQRRAWRWFVTRAGATWDLRDAHLGQPSRRLALINDLVLMLDETAAEDGGRYEDPALRPLFSAEKERLQRVIRDARLASGLPRLLGTLKCPLYPYQIEGVSRFLSAGKLLLADDMGLGKTAEAIAACHALWQAGRVRRGLLCVPASLKPQWLREWQHFSDTPVTVVDGTPAEREALYTRAHTGAGFLIVNYEQVLRDLPLIQRFQPELVVLDEAQRIKNWATKTAACVKTLDAPYRLVLTGTPMENRLEELASLLEWVDPLAIEPKWRLGPWHAQTGDEGQAGARNLDTLRERLAPCMLRRVRSEVLQQLPARTDTRVPVEMTPQQREEHDALNQPIRILISILERRPLTPAEHIRLMSLLTIQRIISNGLAQLNFSDVWPALREAEVPSQSLRDGLFSPKLEVLRELVTQLCVDQGRKVVIFSQWRRMLRLGSWVLRDILGPAGVRAVFFTGDESSRQRTQNIIEFHDDPQTRVMFLTDAGGVGLNLQRAATSCINLELPWNPAVLEQRISRIYRIGQKQPIDVYNLISESGIEARIAFLVGHKKALFTGLFDGTSNELRYDSPSSFLARMKQLLPVEALAPAPTSAGGGEDGEEASSVEREVDHLVILSDESLDEDQVSEPAEPPEHRTQAAAVHTAPPAPEAAPPAGPAEAASDGEAAAPSREQSPAEVREGPAASAAPLSGDAVRRLFAEVRIQKTPAGGLSIEASPAAAGTLAALFSGLAGLLQGAAD